MKRGVKARRIESYESKEHRNRRKTAAIMAVIEQMVEMRYWKQVRGLVDDGNCRVCFQHSETVEYLVPGCQKLGNSEYLIYFTRHNRALMILAVAWPKEHELIGQEVVWYEPRWDRGTVLENAKQS